MVCFWNRQPNTVYRNSCFLAESDDTVPPLFETSYSSKTLLLLLLLSPRQFMTRCCIAKVWSDQLYVSKTQLKFPTYISYVNFIGIVHIWSRVYINIFLNIFSDVWYLLRVYYTVDHVRVRAHRSWKLVKSISMCNRTNIQMKGSTKKTRCTDEPAQVHEFSHFSGLNEQIFFKG